MRSSTSPVPATSSFVGEVSFAKADNFIRSLSALQIGDAAPLPIPLFDSKGDAHFFAAVAAAVAQAESRSPGPSQTLPLLALCDEGPGAHPLNWLNVTERKKDEERRQCHEWYVTIEDDGSIRITYEHGKFGYRREAFDLWSTAFARLAELMAGTCTWHQFGDDESRHTMLGKGQFYWQEPQTQELVPVDNFVFAIPGGPELTLAGVSHRAALTFAYSEDVQSSEWFDDYAQALLRMADVMDGLVAFGEFGKAPNPALHVNATGKGSAADAPWAATGRFIVKSIYHYNDVLPAPVLTYMTGEMARAQLSTADDAWTVRVRDVHQPWRTRKLPPAKASESLRILAGVLNGTLRWADFGSPD